MEKMKAESKRLVLTLSWKLLSIVLALALIGLAVYTKPWEKTSANPRTMEITGEATIKRAPDSFIFYPMYEAKTQEEITAKTNEVVKSVKDLGLGDAGIKTDVSSYDRYKPDGITTDGKTYTASITLSVEDKELAQKVQDYLVGSGATGTITPTTDFKRETKKQLKDEATALAVEDAKKRAEQTAGNLGVKLGKVIEIIEPENYEVYPIAAYDSMAVSAREGGSLPINAGESDYPYSVKVKFEIR